MIGDVLGKDTYWWQHSTYPSPPNLGKGTYERQEKIAVTQTQLKIKEVAQRNDTGPS